MYAHTVYTSPGEPPKYAETVIIRWHCQTLRSSKLPLSHEGFTVIYITFVQHVYNVGPTSKTLGQRCTKVLLMFCVTVYWVTTSLSGQRWDIFVLWNIFWIKRCSLTLTWYYKCIPIHRHDVSPTLFGTATLIQMTSSVDTKISHGHWWHFTYVLALPTLLVDREVFNNQLRYYKTCHKLVGHMPNELSNYNACKRLLF